MNKLTKVGCSALCGSLAAISAANAGDLTVTGSAHLTYVSLGGSGDTTVGNPIGMQSNVTFKGSGELDNGWTFALSIADGDGGAYSSSNIDIVMGGLGSLNFIKVIVVTVSQLMITLCLQLGKKLTVQD
jgi:hypothetical protein